MTDDPQGRSGPDSRAPRDRRDAHRAAIEIPAALYVGTREISCSVRDLSVRGISLVLREAVAPGMVARVAFRLPNARRTIEVAGVLVRSSGGRDANTLGLQFIEPDADAIRVIETFVGRNRSDLPFSRRRGDGPDTGRIETSESAASLRGLYRKAVDEVGDKDDKRGGLLRRWFRRGS